MTALKRVLILSIAVIFVFAACGKKPTQAVDDAKAALEALAKEGADTYAAEEYKKLSDALTAAMDEVTAQDGKVFKKFGKANEMLAQVMTDAEALKSALPAKIEAAKTAALALQTEAATAVTEAKALLAKAPKGKGTKADIEAFKADLAGLEAALPEIQAALDGQDYLAAADKAKVIKEKAMGIVDQINQAIAKVKGR